MTDITEYPVKGIDTNQFNDMEETEKKPDITLAAGLGFIFNGIRVSFGQVADKLFTHFWKTTKFIMDRMPYHYLDYYSHRNGWVVFDDAGWGKRQAQFMWSLIKADPGELPIHLDIENASAKYAPAIGSLTAGYVMKIARSFLEEIDRLSGGFAAIYSSPGMLTWFPDWFKDRNLWLAWYRDSISLEEIQAVVAKFKWRGKVMIVQHRSDGDIDGDRIPDGLRLGMETRACDLNVFLGADGKGSLAEYSKWVGTDGVTPELPVEEDVIIPGEMPVGRTKTIEVMTVFGSSGLNIRSSAEVNNKNWIGWMPTGKEVEVLQKISTGQNVFARVGQGQFVAIRYNGTTLLK